MDSAHSPRSSKISDLFLDFLQTVKTLRGPEGCPGDKKLTPTDLNSTLLEETYEVIDAVDSKDPQNLKEELGDLLLQIIFHSQIAEESDQFRIEDVIRSINEKMIRRHPHVFASGSAKSIEEVTSQWEVIKTQERMAKGKFRRQNIDPFLEFPHSCLLCLRLTGWVRRLLKLDSIGKLQAESSKKFRKKLLSSPKEWRKKILQ